MDKLTRNQRITTYIENEDLDKELKEHVKHYSKDRGYKTYEAGLKVQQIKRRIDENAEKLRRSFDVYTKGKDYE